MALVEESIKTIITCNDMKPNTFKKIFLKFHENFSGEKAEDVYKITEETHFTKPILWLTSRYVKDKDNFLCLNNK